MIEIRNLNGRLGDFVLRDIELTVGDGEYLVLLGPTGAGKTVLIEYIVGICRQDSGEIRIDGQDITPLYTEERNIGYVPQDYALFPNLNVEKNIAYGLEAKRLPRPEINTIVERFIARLGIDYIRKRMPLNLSGGEKQRVALGRALAMRPAIVLLDEPLSALDENLRSVMARELRKLQQDSGATFIHVCHNFEEASDVADRIALMHKGRLIQTGTLAELLRKPTSEFAARFFKVTNLFPAEARGSRLAINGVELACSRNIHGAVLAGIRPEHIGIANGAATDGVNLLQAKVIAVRRKVSMTELELDAGIPLVAHCMGDLVPQPGQQVVVSIKPEDIILI